MLDRWRLKGFHIQVQGDSADMRKLWGYTYLKHNCTNYDDICQRVRTWRFSSFAYPVLLHRINQEILDRYPQCLDRVKGLRRSPILLCHACHRSGAGTFNGHYYTAPPDWYYRRSSNGHGINIYCTRECSRPNNNVSRWTRRRLESARRKGEWAG